MNRSMCAVMGLLFAGCFAGGARADIYYVNGSCGDDSWSGTLQDCQEHDGPKKTIQEGINAADDGDEVIVFGWTGVYGVPESEGYVRGLSFSDGGQAREITLRCAEGQYPCVIDCAGTPKKRCRVFDFYDDSATSDTVVEGFTITGGYVNGGSNPVGGGIRCFKSEPTIRDCIIEGNQADSGGGIGLWGWYQHDPNWAPQIENCTIRNNQATEDNGGGGLPAPIRGRRHNRHVGAR